MATINGTSGSDVLNGTADNDIINGFGASDTISGLGGNDRGLGGGGADFIQGSFGLDTLGGGSGNDTLNGNKGRDRIFGNSNNDLLIGGGGDDTLNGGGGSDTLRGGFGDDSLTGGSGRDRFLIGSSQGIETITDFEDGIDQLRLLQGERLDGISFSDLELRESGTSTRIFLDRPGSQRDGDLLAIIKNIAPNQITEDDIFVPNEPPVAANDSFSGAQEAAIGGNVLADNGSGADSDPDGNPLAIVALNGSASAVGNTTAIASGAFVTLNSNGTFFYTSDGAFAALKSGETGSDSFTYTVSDGKGGMDTATVTVNLTGVNNSPTVTTNTGATADEGGTSIFRRARLEGTDPDNGSAGLTFTITSATSNGRIELNTDPGTSITSFTQADINNGRVQYVHDGSETTSDSFDFSLADGGQDGAKTDTGTFSFTINPVNDPPVAVDDELATNEDTTLNGNLFAANPTTADSDPDNASFTVTQVNGNAASVGSQIALGSGAQLTVNSNGSFTYNPNGQFENLADGTSTTDSFTYQIGDGDGGFSSATATVAIAGMNDAPVAINDAFTTDEDTALTTGNVLSANPTTADSDIDDGDTFTVTQVNGSAEDVGNLITLSSGAQLTLNANGTFNYDPKGAFETITTNATDSFTYQIGDGNGGFDTATATITVTPVNDLPTAVDDVFNTDQHTTLNDDLFAANPTTPDSDPETPRLSLRITQVNGSAANVDSAVTLASGAQLIVNNDGTFSYNPNGQFDNLAGGTSATDSFTYQIGDGNGGFDSATATVTIAGTNDAPVAVNDAFTTDEDTALTTGDVLSANPTTTDSDIDDGDTFTVTQVNGSAGNVGNLINLSSGAQLTLNSNGTFAYDPSGAFDGITSNTIDTFTYQIGDGNMGFDTATATITITPVNDAPVNTVPIAQTTNSVTPIAFTTISISDVDAGGGSLQSVIATTFGTLTVAPGSGANVSSDGSDSVTITGTLAQINAALNGLDYDSDGMTGIATITLTTTDQGNTGSGGVRTDTDFISVTVTPPNDAPVVDLDGPGGTANFSTTFTEGSGAIAIADTDSVITDADAGDNIERLTLTLTNAQAGDSLSINGGEPALPMGISLDGTSTSSAIVLTGTATPATYTTALQLIQFNNTSETPNTTNRTVTVVANDGDVDSATATTTIAVTAVNDPPTITAPSYTGNANLTLTVADGAGDLLDGATDPDGTTVAVKAETVTSAAAAATTTTADDNNVTINADGSFTYQAVAGFVGNDTFVYELQDSGSPLPAATTDVTATITLMDLDGAGSGDDVLWFIDEDSTGDNLGTQVNPFTSLATFNAATTKTGDYIFLDTDTGDRNNDGVDTYGGGITLLDNQTLIGDGTSGTTLAALTGITLGSHNSLGADFTAFNNSGTNPVVQNASGNGINLGAGNTIRGLDVGNSSGMGIRGTSVGNLTISDVTINNTIGGGFEVTTGGDVRNVALDGITISGGEHGISLANTTGNVTFNTVNINGTTGSAVELTNVAGNVTVNGAIGSTTDAGNAANAAVDINGGTADVTIAANITNTVGKAVEISGRIGNVVNISGNINHSASGATGIDVNGNSGGVINFSGASKTINSGTATAVDLTNNGGATVNFTNGGLDIDTTSGTGFNATGGGNLSVRDSGNTVDTTTGTAVNIVGTFISGAHGVTFQSINRNGGSNVAINLAGTGNGAFSVTGSGTTTGSGGTIQNITNSDAITLNNTGGLVTLKNLIIQDISSSSDSSATLNTLSGVDAIHGQRVNGGLALDNVTIRRISDSAINGSTLTNGSSSIASGNSTSWNGLSIVNSTFNNTNRFHVANRGDDSREGQVVIDGITGTVLVDNSTFQNGAYGLRLRSANSGTLDVTVQRSNFLELEKEFTTGSLNSVGGIGIEVIQRGAANVVARIGDPNETNPALGNLFENNYRASVSIQHESSSSTGTVDAILSQNTFRVNDHLTDRQGAGGFGFDFPQGGVFLNARGGDMEGIISNNTFDEVFHANGGVGQLTLRAEDNSDAEFIVNNNNFRGAWDYIADIRADGNNSAAIHWFDNTVTGFTRTAAQNTNTDLGAIPQILPFESVLVRLQNNGNLDMTVQNSDVPDHDTIFNAGSDSSYEFNVTSSGGTLNLELDNNDATNGFEFDQDAGALNLFRDLSVSSDLSTVVMDNGNTGSANVTNGSVTLSNTDPTLPDITIG
ncbi:MAG: Ig-like domain-containing protein [Cyanobacteria bacterium P01_E01_bin.45]